MAKLVEKFYSIMGLGDEIEEMNDASVAPHSGEERESAFSRRSAERAERTERPTAPVVSLVTERQKKELKVVVCEPKTFDEARAIADHLKNRRQVILNLEKADREMAQRVIDFISGTTYALNGSMQKVGANIFVFAPSNVDISGEVTGDDLSSVRSPLAWANKG
ncbi:conserved hypothetical protein [Heliomicrobium modesticaldum Ice1]|uniref:Cell division protein SepF n=1 Tax=Heliobacterium modesticaldum (strain ATCC 51547 / Ice1) TaxID=498761 RepID=SEPF_HELMI|nr:cell division protein SepF [Heliomicrobium modesticaldum]B0TGN6.1 RecName: Full=Cell division protein SepF [Heliomicrobium modesticaldum Ice1]ABZ84647.1 conserved hypothetical protein [Heliomicrobium modesticaldum Ice1]